MGRRSRFYPGLRAGKRKGRCVTPLPSADRVRTVWQAPVGRHPTANLPRMGYSCLSSGLCEHGQETDGIGVTVLDEVRRIVPSLEAAAADDDALRRVGDSTWSAMLGSGALRALQPARFGGGEVSLFEFVDAAMVLSAASPSAGWVAGVIGVHPWQLALFPDEAQQEMWFLL